MNWSDPKPRAKAGIQPFRFAPGTRMGLLTLKTAAQNGHYDGVALFKRREPGKWRSEK